MSGVPISPSFADAVDFQNASRGFIGALEPCIIKASNGRIVWNNDEYYFLNDKCPSTANPKLWRQGQLNSKQGLFQVADGMYQVRGFDLSNMTIVEAREGVIVIDPLTSSECAAAALALYCKFRGKRKVTGMIFSHPHIDHFGGAQGILPDEPIMIIAPEGFMEEALSEKIFAGESMRRRAAYMYGNQIPKGPEGQIGCGLGMIVSRGSNSLIPPNVLIKETGEERVVDGVRMIFQVVPETEAPAEINFYFPDIQALYIAECATHCLHNIITLRGALVRDAKKWSQHLDETIELFGQAESLCAGHNWPTWGQENIIKLVSEQRDMYAYLHDQTLRMMNQGMTGIEIAEKMTMPPDLQRAWHAQGFYGSVSHNVKGIYQRYMGWFDGNPVNLWKHTPLEEGRRYIACMGGLDETVRKAVGFRESGDLRFAATLLGHAVAAEPHSQKAKE
jgi:alkyl sulfatase BDS1-like metallo-beta-lactamase superfamily hydrolase